MTGNQTPSKSLNRENERDKEQFMHFWKKWKNKMRNCAQKKKFKILNL